MPLVGGGGAPNVSGGANPAGTGSGISYIGNHAYAYSGAIATDDTTFATHLDFTTGSSYLMGQIDFMGPAKESDVADGALALFQVKFDDQTVMEPKVSSNPEAMPANYHASILIPPYTRVVVGCKAASGSQITTVSIVGRVYA